VGADETREGGGIVIGDNWGATAAERSRPLPCDGLLPSAGFVGNRAVSIEAPPPTIFRWLCQLRVAPYSYDRLDNLGRRSPRELSPGLDDLEAGQRFMSIFRLHSWERDEHITLRGSRTAVTYAIRPGSRLVVRVLYGGPFGRALAIGDLVMMRKQLLTLKDLCERDAQLVAAGASPGGAGGSSSDSRRRKISLTT
jgi:hypothetical protein